MKRLLARLLGRPVPLRSEQEVTEALGPVAEYLLAHPEITGWGAPTPDGRGLVHLAVTYADDGGYVPLRPERPLFTRPLS